MASSCHQNVPDRILALHGPCSGGEQFFQLCIFGNAQQSKLSVSNKQSVVSLQDSLSGGVQFDNPSISFGNDDAGGQRTQRELSHTGPQTAGPKLDVQWCRLTQRLEQFLKRTRGCEWPLSVLMVRPKMTVCDGPSRRRIPKMSETPDLRTKSLYPRPIGERVR
jgi:hypothetical protein